MDYEIENTIAKKKLLIKMVYIESVLVPDITSLSFNFVIYKY